jgi:DNA-binding IclR family transcriptional regulator
MVVRDRRNERRAESGVQVIARAAAILRALHQHPEGLSFSQIAQEVGLPRTTVHRIVTALQREQLVAAAGAAGGTRLGPGLTQLANATQVSLREVVHGYLEQLSRTVNETVDLAVLDGDQVLFIDQVAAPQRLRAVSAVGVTFPLHCTANGKPFLAAMPRERVEQLLPLELPACTLHTITSRDELLVELEQVRATGIGYDREEHTMGICAVGATIGNAHGNLAAISIPLPATRFYGNEEKLVAELRRTCEAINRSI